MIKIINKTRISFTHSSRRISHLIWTVGITFISWFHWREDWICCRISKLKRFIDHQRKINEIIRKDEWRRRNDLNFVSSNFNLVARYYNLPIYIKLIMIKIIFSVKEYSTGRFKYQINLPFQQDNQSSMV
jgi:hypothetical protein